MSEEQRELDRGRVAGRVLRLVADGESIATVFAERFSDVAVDDLAAIADQVLFHAGEQDRDSELSYRLAHARLAERARGAA